MSEKSVAQVLNKAAEIVERGWCQGVYAIDAAGFAMGDEDPDVALEGVADRFCAVGALTRAAGGSNDLADIATDVLVRVIGRHVPAWNDAEGRTQAEVVAKLREAAALALSQEGTR